MILLPVLVFAQTRPAEDAAGLDYEGKAIVAVLPFAGKETDMALRFHEETIRIVAGLEKYTPREVQISTLNSAGIEIPTDMPPNRNLTAGARYALTGGVYSGSKDQEYYLQLWLWDMTGSTMIYTDDLVYEDITGAIQSLPGLVEWLFSHIYEVTTETPETDIRQDPLLTLGLRAGPSQRWYISPGETAPGAWALSFEGGISGALRLNSLLALQIELIFSGDNLVYRGLNQEGPDYILANEKFTSYSLMIPFLLKLNLRPGIWRISPLVGIYVMAPLGETRYRMSTEGEDRSYSYTFSVPAGFTAGLEAAVKYGPGLFLAGVRYAGDFGDINIDDDQKTSYRRDMLSIFFGYEFGFLDTKRRGGSL
jgi:hypothetical protein